MVRLFSRLDEVSSMLLLLGLDLRREQFTISGDGAHIFTHSDAPCDVLVSASSSKVSQAAVSITQFEQEPHVTVRQSQQGLQEETISICVWHETLLECFVQRGKSSVAWSKWCRSMWLMLANIMTAQSVGTFHWGDEENQFTKEGSGF